jgi:Tfp pilus assembly PilM family ATPase
VSVLSSLFAPSAPTVAIELASRRVTVVEVGRSGKGASVVGYASEALPAEAIVPAPGGVNIPTPAVVADAIRRALERAGVRATRRAALIVHDSVARVSLLTFEQLPPKAADVEQLIRWQLKKSTPYPIDEAQIAWFPAHRTEAGVVIGAVAARRDVIAEYEKVAGAAGVHAGLVDLACLNVMNAVVGANASTPADWLLINLSPEATALAIGRGADLMFYRHRPVLEGETLSALVHQTAMYHEDRLGGTRFSRVWLCGGGVGPEAAQARIEIHNRLGVPVEAVDVRSAAQLGGRVTASADVLDALAAPVGVLLRDRKAA